jgi:hypothetical protein
MTVQPFKDWRFWFAVAVFTAVFLAHLAVLVIVLSR